MKKFRLIDYLDDGVSAYQCLECKAEWQARLIQNAFCPACGVRFEGRHGQPRSDCRRIQLFWEAESINSKLRENATIWYIEAREIAKDGSSTEWQWVHYIDPSFETSIVCEFLKCYRQAGDDFVSNPDNNFLEIFKFEFRARLHPRRWSSRTPMAELPYDVGLAPRYNQINFQEYRRKTA